MPSESPPNDVADARPLAVAPTVADVPPAPANLLDPAGHVATDLPCSCGYNLRTLPAGGLCPECAAPVARALELCDLQPWLKPLYFNLSVLRALAASWLAAGILEAISAAVEEDLSVGGLLRVFAFATEIVSVLMTLVSPVFLFGLTLTPPAALGTACRFRARSAVQYLLIASIACIALMVINLGEYLAPEWMPALGVAALGAMSLLPATAVRHVADVVRSTGNPQPARFIGWVSVALGFLYPSLAILLLTQFDSDVLAGRLALVGTFVLASLLAFYALDVAHRTLRPLVSGGVPEQQVNPVG